MLDRLKRMIRRVVLKGHNVECCICGKRSLTFLPAGDEIKAHTRCPVCYSNDRSRQLWLLLKPILEATKTQQHLLHIAPELSLGNLLSRHSQLQYTAIDKYEKGYHYPAWVKQGDITALQFPDNTFDLLICSHVLEHVNDDRTAMKELYRVLKPGGTGFLLLPYFPELATTFEDASVTSPEERKKRFGQADHVRKYGNDLILRLQQAGFQTMVLHMEKEYTNEQRVRLGLINAEPVFVVKK